MMKFNIKCSSETSFFVNRDCITTAYFEDVRKFPILSVEEERNLLHKMTYAINEKEKENAKKKLIESNLRFVISIAKKLGTRETFLDLVNEGNIGLIKAIERFDINKKCKLITYAVSWIVAYIQNYQINCEKTVVPPNALKLYNYVKNVTRQFLNENERNPTPQEIADLVREKFNFTITNLEDVELTQLISIDEKYSAIDDDNTFEHSDIYISRTSGNNIQDDIENEYKTHKLNFFLDKLDKREKEIVKRHYGIGREEESFDTIAYDMNICGERVRQICVGAVKKMQKYKKMTEK